MSDFKYELKKVSSTASPLKTFDNPQGLETNFNIYKKNINKSSTTPETSITFPKFETVNLEEYLKEVSPTTAQEILELDYTLIEQTLNSYREQYSDIAPAIDSLLKYIKENEGNITYNGLCESLTSGCWIVAESFLDNYGGLVSINEKEFKDKLMNFLQDEKNKEDIIASLEAFSSGKGLSGVNALHALGLLSSLKKFIKDECYSLLNIDTFIKEHPQAEPIIDNVANYLTNNFSNITYDGLTNTLTDGLWKTIDLSIEDACETYLSSLKDVWLVGDDMYNLAEETLKNIANEDNFKNALENFFDDKSNEETIMNLVENLKSGDSTRLESNLSDLTDSLVEYFVGEYIEIEYDIFNLESKLQTVAESFLTSKIENYLSEKFNI